MIIAKIDDEAFVELVEKAPLIAFQRLEFGYAVAAPLVAFYAPVDHPGGGNLDELFEEKLGCACLARMEQPRLRTLRPTAKPIPTQALLDYLATFDPGPERISAFSRCAGDHPSVVDSETQIVIQAIEEYDRPDLREAMKPLKRELLIAALDLVLQHADAARDLCEEEGENRPALVKMNIMQATTAMKTCLEMLLKP